ncbi:DUF7660 family protein [Brevibacillus laterosporus]|uniref:DUF7660 family protein n=1 Tax=Brevibacillus laterosporus TaxID=1465 RepID=UPI003B96C939
MVEDLEQNRSQWANTSPADYLNGIASWIEDRYELMDNAKEEFEESVDWNATATVLFVGSRYE